MKETTTTRVFKKKKLYRGYLTVENETKSAQPNIPTALKFKCEHWNVPPFQPLTRWYNFAAATMALTISHPG